MAEGPFPWSQQRIREMTGTAQEFRRTLKSAFGPLLEGGEESSQFVIREGPVALQFSLSDGPLRRIGALQLATLQLEIRVLSGEESEANALLAKVDRATQRGGG